MPGVRFDRFFASTAIILLLSAGAGGALAEPKSGAQSEAAPSAPGVPSMAAPAARESGETAATRGDSADQAAAPPAAIAKPDPTGAEPTTATAARTEATPASPASAPTSDRAAAEPIAPVAPEASAAPPQPAASGGGDEVPIPAASAPPATTPGEPAVTTVPSVVVDANAPITEQLHDLANGKFDRIIGGKKERTAIDAFYSGRNYAPLWITDGKPNAHAQAAIGYLGRVDADGLDPADYPVPNFASLADPAALAEAELRLTAAIVTYTRHAQTGRVHWTRVSGDIYYDQKAPAPSEVLAKMGEANDVGGALAAYEPQDPAYLALKAKLAELRTGKEDTGKTPIPNGPALKLGMQDERVPQLRERLGLSGDDGTTYDKALADAVKKFQQEHELKATGMLTAATLEALNGRKPDRPVDTIIANLERWRWMPHDLGRTYVIVNLPDFTLRVMRDGKQLWKTKIVDGKPELPTPIMSAEMKYITVNPTWNVPPSIVAKEYMPVLQQDPSMLERMGLAVSTNPDGTVHISQPPGEKNALGRLRFNFPNKFLVYQHDTPQKQLFAYDKRAFSHGCMRVQDPVKYAELLLSIVRPREGYTEDRIRKMFGDSEVDISFPTFIPVHLTYQTAFVDEDGKLQFREDVYGRDKALLAILKGEERKVADTPIERKDNAVRRELLAMPDSTGPFGRSYFPNGGNFFSRLFGGPDPTPAPAPGPRKRSAQRPTEIQ
jgi:L,D-transpeptidase YcbB